MTLISPQTARGNHWKTLPSGKEQSCCNCDSNSCTISISSSADVAIKRCSQIPAPTEYSHLVHPEGNSVNKRYVELSCFKDTSSASS